MWIAFALLSATFFMLLVDFSIVSIAGGLHATFEGAIAVGLVMLLAAVLDLRHAARAEIPVRHYVPFGKLHHRVSVKA